QAEGQHRKSKFQGRMAASVTGMHCGLRRIAFRRLSGVTEEWGRGRKPDELPARSGQTGQLRINAKDRQKKWNPIPSDLFCESGNAETAANSLKGYCMKANGVRVERDGPVTTIILSRPDRRNAVDRPTADALAEAFLAFEHDTAALVAVLWG